MIVINQSINLHLLTSVILYPVKICIIIIIINIFIIVIKVLLILIDLFIEYIF